MIYAWYSSSRALLVEQYYVYAVPISKYVHTYKAEDDRLFAFHFSLGVCLLWLVTIE